MNATVTSVPPLLVFPRSSMKAELLDSTPPGSIAARDRAGWFQTFGFTQWINNFSRFSKVFKKEPVILKLDSHDSYSKNIEVIDRVLENVVHVVCLPPHGTVQNCADR